MIANTDFCIDSSGKIQKYFSTNCARLEDRSETDPARVIRLLWLKLFEFR